MSEPKFINGPKFTDPTSVWYYFLRENAKPPTKAQCKTCKLVMKSLGGTTSSLWGHLSQHAEIEVPKKDENANAELHSKKANVCLNVLI